MCCHSYATHQIFLHKFLMVFIQVDAQGLKDTCSSCMYCHPEEKGEPMLTIFCIFGSSLKKKKKEPHSFDSKLKVLKV